MEKSCVHNRRTDKQNGLYTSRGISFWLGKERSAGRWCTMDGHWKLAQHKKQMPKASWFRVWERPRTGKPTAKQAGKSLPAAERRRAWELSADGYVASTQSDEKVLECGWGWVLKNSLYTHCTVYSEMVKMIGFMSLKNKWHYSVLFSGPEGGRPLLTIGVFPSRHLSPPVHHASAEWVLLFSSL